MLQKDGVRIPFPPCAPPPTSIQTRFAWKRPENISIVGSFLLKSMVTSPSGTNSVDLVVQMPSALFQEKDYMNHRYFYKRSFYLAVLARALNEVDDIRVEFEYLNGDENRPILVVTGSETDGISILVLTL
jgi:U3 small nucleolar RNA-associated protein 22